MACLACLNREPHAHYEPSGWGDTMVVPINQSPYAHLSDKELLAEKRAIEDECEKRHLNPVHWDGTD